MISKRALEHSAAVRKWWILKGDTKLREAAAELERLHMLRCMVQDGEGEAALAMLADDAMLDAAYAAVTGYEPSGDSTP